LFINSGHLPLLRTISFHTTINDKDKGVPIKGSHCCRARLASQSRVSLSYVSFIQCFRSFNIISQKLYIVHSVLEDLIRTSTTSKSFSLILATMSETSHRPYRLKNAEEISRAPRRHEETLRDLLRRFTRGHETLEQLFVSAHSTGLIFADPNLPQP
jgi:hypothetical protein